MTYFLFWMIYIAVTLAGLALFFYGIKSRIAASQARLLCLSLAAILLTPITVLSAKTEMAPAWIASLLRLLTGDSQSAQQGLIAILVVLLLVLAIASVFEYLCVRRHREQIEQHNVDQLHDELVAADADVLRASRD